MMPTRFRQRERARESVDLLSGSILRTDSSLTTESYSKDLDRGNAAFKKSTQKERLSGGVLEQNVPVFCGIEVALAGLSIRNPGAVERTNERRLYHLF